MNRETCPPMNSENVQNNSPDTPSDRDLSQRAKATKRKNLKDKMVLPQSTLTGGSIGSFLDDEVKRKYSLKGLVNLSQTSVENPRPYLISDIDEEPEGSEKLESDEKSLESKVNILRVNNVDDESYLSPTDPQQQDKENIKQQILQYLQESKRQNRSDIYSTDDESDREVEGLYQERPSRWSHITEQATRVDVSEEPSSVDLPSVDQPSDTIAKEEGSSQSSAVSSFGAASPAAISQFALPEFLKRKSYISHYKKPVSYQSSDSSGFFSRIKEAVSHNYALLVPVAVLFIVLVIGASVFWFSPEKTDSPVSIASPIVFTTKELVLSVTLDKDNTDYEVVMLSQPVPELTVKLSQPMQSLFIDDNGSLLKKVEFGSDGVMHFQLNHVNYKVSESVDGDSLTIRLQEVSGSE